MRHIPEDELHAYLDQGLSRSQCVEIESHLAVCSSCRATRDGIAALRDRTTALLATLAPPRRFPPTFDSLRSLADQRVHTRRRRLRAAAWAASLVAALGLGWTASTLVGPGRATSVATREFSPASPSPSRSIAAEPRPVAAEPVPSPGRPSPAPAPSAIPADSKPVRAEAEAAAARIAGRQAREDSIRAAKLAVLDLAPALELEPLDEGDPAAGEQFAGIWRTMSWDGAQSEAGESLPHIDGLPVLRVQVQANDQGKRPLMVVAQQLASGQVIQTIEGPASDVSQLLSRRSTAAAGNGLSVTISDAEPAGDHAMAMQRGDRMIAITGALPSDSLRAMIRRMNAEMRSK
ncbi:MAG TPA: zf-HC2 domain-containing protein [Gemmatimonadales bacterium]|nr:zf-HC2 domain-containing protein [Gemmatimonadales bacterium]